MKNCGKSKLKYVCEISAGQSAPQGNDKYSENGIPFIRAGNLEALTLRGNEGLCQKVSQAVAKEHKLKLYPKGTILFAKSGMSTKKGYVHVLKENAYVVSHLACIIPTDKIEPDFLKYYFLYNKPNRLVRDDSYPSISLLDISNITIPLPTLTDQILIINIFKKIEKQIFNKKLQLEKLEQLAKSRFIEMFGDLKYHTKYSSIKLKEICKTLSGGTPTTKHPEYYTGNIPWITTVQLGENYISGENPKAFITEEAIKNSATHLIPANNILFGTRVGVGKSSINTAPICTNQDINAIMNIDETKWDLLFIKLVLDHYQDYFDSIKKGATIKGITIEELTNIDIPMVPICLQKEYSMFIQQLDKSKFRIKKSLEKLELTYKALLQEYFG